MWLWFSSCMNAPEGARSETRDHGPCHRMSSCARRAARHCKSPSADSTISLSASPPIRNKLWATLSLISSPSKASNPQVKRATNASYSSSSISPRVVVRTTETRFSEPSSARNSPVGACRPDGIQLTAADARCMPLIPDVTKLAVGKERKLTMRRLPTPQVRTLPSVRIRYAKDVRREQRCFPEIHKRARGLAGVPEEGQYMTTPRSSDSSSSCTSGTCTPSSHECAPNPCESFVICTPRDVESTPRDGADIAKFDSFVICTPRDVDLSNDADSYALCTPRGVDLRREACDSFLIGTPRDVASGSEDELSDMYSALEGIAATCGDAIAIDTR